MDRSRAGGARGVAPGRRDRGGSGGYRDRVDDVEMIVPGRDGHAGAIGPRAERDAGCRECLSRLRGGIDALAIRHDDQVAGREADRAAGNRHCGTVGGVVSAGRRDVPGV